MYPAPVDKPPAAEKPAAQDKAQPQRAAKASPKEGTLVIKTTPELETHKSRLERLLRTIADEG